MPDINGTAPLEALALIAEQLGAKALQQRIALFRRRVEDGRFHVVCIGAFKRGKSTLVNALVGRDLLAAGLLPVTTVPTVLCHGTELTVRIDFADGSRKWVLPGELSRYTTEQGNPRNALGVESVHIRLPSPLLADGLCLVDTPGLGSVFEESGAKTRAFLPQIDAAVVVLGSDPPLSADELGLIRRVADQRAPMIFVLNKADRFTAQERQEASRFACDVLAGALGRDIGRILEVSAAERLAGVGPERDWTTLVDTLQRLSTESRPGLVAAAVARGVLSLARQCTQEIGEMSGELMRTREESDARLDAMRSRVARIAHESLLLGFRMQREEHELLRDAAARRQSLLRLLRPKVGADFALQRVRVGALPATALRSRVAEVVHSVVEHHLAAWLAEEQRVGDAWYGRTTHSLVAQALAMLNETGADPALGMAGLAAGFDDAESFLVPGAVDPAHLAHIAPPPPSRIHRWFERFAPIAWVRSAITRDADAWLAQALATHAQAVENDLQRRVEERNRRLINAVNETIAGVFERADRATALAQTAQAEGAPAVRRELDRLAALRVSVDTIARGIASERR